MGELDYLKGKSVLDVVLELPKFDWYMNNRQGIAPIKTNICTLIFVSYQQEKPRTDIDRYPPVDADSLKSLDDLSFVTVQDGRMIGLTSKVQIGEQHENRYAHLPMMDFDTHDNFSEMKEAALLDLLKEKIREDTQLEKGVILKSGPKRNYHFLGIGSLLSEEELVNFAGLCLLMRQLSEKKEKLGLADSRYIGHMLTPLKHLVDLDNPTGFLTQYSYTLRFATLRLTKKPKYKHPPKVIAVLD
ncbi:hypothetical protein KY346_03545 [Candidatus Woesearchaeota archaeon]|nr:hypothetical protein [Candidatus Woesearchaeota archaeon]